VAQLILTLLILVTILPAQAESSSQQPPKVVEVANVTLGPVQRNAQLVGRVKSHRASTLRARRPGLIKQINYPDSAEVRQDDQLLIIDDPEVLQRYQLAKKQSELAHDEFKRQHILLDKGTLTESEVT